LALPARAGSGQIRSGYRATFAVPRPVPDRGKLTHIYRTQAPAFAMQQSPFASFRSQRLDPKRPGARNIHLRAQRATSRFAGAHREAF